MPTGCRLTAGRQIGSLSAQVNLTDGSLVQFGCVNTTSAQTGCIPGQLDVGIRMASFRFSPGERVTQMALYSGPDNTGRANARAGAISFATSNVSSRARC